jgi:hypothetical protein
MEDPANVANGFLFMPRPPAGALRRRGARLGARLQPCLGLNGLNGQLHRCCLWGTAKRLSLPRYTIGFGFQLVYAFTASLPARKTSQAIDNFRLFLPAYPTTWFHRCPI